MSFFPKCTFQYFLDGGPELVPGERNQGRLVLHVPEPIERAERLLMNLRTEAWAGYGSGKNRRVVRQQLLMVPLRVDLPPGGMPAGRHEYPFHFDVPAWMPPAFDGNDCGIYHELTAELDVDWAFDPVSKLRPVVRLRPARGRRAPVILRSPNGFHESIVLEVSLDSAVVAEDEPLSGKIAVRAGHEARWDGIVLVLSRMTTVAMGHGDRRAQDVSSVRIPKASLLSGEAVPFLFPPDPTNVPTFGSPQLTVDYVVRVEVDIPWAIDPQIEVPFTVLPRGSEVSGEGSELEVGGARLRQMAHYVAQQTGLSEGKSPVIVRGRQGAVDFWLTDAPREGGLGVDVSLVFPGVGVDVRMRPLGVLDGFRESPLLPRELRDKVLLRVDAPEGRYARAPLGEAELHAILDGLGRADAVRMTDHSLEFHVPTTDDAERLVELARFVAHKAEIVGRVLAKLPFPTALEAHRAAWESAAAERGAFLVPTGPHLVGMPIGVRTLGGEERTFVVKVGTEWGGKPHGFMEISCVSAPLPGPAAAMLEGQVPHALLAPLRGRLTSLAQEGPHTVRGHAPEIFDDPRAAMPTVDALVAFWLDVRGERRVDAPYR